VLAWDRAYPGGAGRARNFLWLALSLRFPRSPRLSTECQWCEVEAFDFGAPGFSSGNRQRGGERAGTDQLPRRERIGVRLTRHGGRELREAERRAAQRVLPPSLLGDLSVFERRRLERRQLLDERGDRRRIDGRRLADDERGV